ncbi:hypothetical protein RhiJN_16147 [Ceratobasidium sp. AG-Ba]|nr:hypothetical protein RhiJN_16147 [Ceratobasidium sp. AG-Ba]
MSTGTPYPFNVSLPSALIHAVPFTSNTSSGWAASCNECANGVWSTNAVNSSISFSFYGWDVAFDGQVQGDMSIKLAVDGIDTSLTSTPGSIFELKGLEPFKQHLVELSVHSASSGSLLSVSQARVNGSTFSDLRQDRAIWDLPTNDGSVTWNGFQQQPSASGSFSPTTYVSSKAGDTGSVQFNGSAVTIYGPCSPTSGLLRVQLDSNEAVTVNTSSPITSPNCLLYQTPGFSALSIHTLSVTSADQNPVSINHFEFCRVFAFASTTNNVAPGAIVGGVIGGIVLIAILIVVYSMRSRKTRQKVNRAFSMFCS